MKLKKKLWGVRNRLLHTLGRLSLSNRMTPSFLIIGVQKGGTSSLFFYLKFHPQIRRPFKKEIHFFNIHYKKGLNWYLAHYPTKANGAITGEASPDYLFHPLAPERAKALNPKMKLVVLLRDPIERAYSAYQMNRRMGLDKHATFQEAVDYELKLRGQTNDYTYDRHNFFYLERGLYSKQLAKWSEHFPREQMLVLKSEFFFSNTNDALIRVYDFLGVQRELPPTLKPMNVGQYPELSEKLYASLTHFYEQDLIELKSKWNIAFDIK